MNRKIKQNMHEKNTNKEENIKQKKSVTVTYTGLYMRTLTNIFRNTNIQITYKLVKKNYAII